MTLSQLFLLPLGSLVLSLVVGHVLLTRLRVIRLECDLLAIRIRLRKIASRMHCLTDPEYVEVASLLDGSMRDLRVRGLGKAGHQVAMDLLIHSPPKTSNHTLSKLLERTRREIATTWKESPAPWVGKLIELHDRDIALAEASAALDAPMSLADSDPAGIEPEDIDGERAFLVARIPPHSIGGTSLSGKRALDELRGKLLAAELP